MGLDEYGKRIAPAQERVDMGEGPNGEPNAELGEQEADHQAGDGQSRQAQRS